MLACFSVRSFCRVREKELIRDQHRSLVGLFPCVVTLCVCLIFLCCCSTDQMENLSFPIHFLKIKLLQVGLLSNQINFQSLYHTQYLLKLPFGSGPLRAICFQPLNKREESRKVDIVNKKSSGSFSTFLTPRGCILHAGAGLRGDCERGISSYAVLRKWHCSTQITRYFPNRQTQL